MNPRARRWWIGAAALTILALVLAAAAVPLWRAAFARAAADGRLASWANRRPERIRIEWRAVASRWPLRVEIEGLSIRGRTASRLWEVTAERASALWDPLAMLGREVRFREVRGEGVAVRVARFGDGPAPLGPPIDPAFVPRLEPPSPAPPSTLAAAPAPPAKVPWSFALHDVEIARLAEVWIDDRQATGEASVRGGFEMRRRRMAEILPAEVRFARVAVQVGAERVAEGVAGHATFRILPYAYRGVTTTDLLPRFSGDLAIAGRLDADAAVDYLLRGWPTLDYDGGDAELEADLEIRRGAFRPGSRLSLRSASERLRFLGFEARGAARLTARVERGLAGMDVVGDARLVTTVELPRWELGRPEAPAVVAGEGMRIVATARRPRLDRPPAAGALAVDLGEATAADLRFVNAYLPAASQVAIESGDATLSGRLEITAPDGPRGGDGRGEIDVRARSLHLVAAGERLTGDVRLDARLSRPDLEAGRFSITGSRLEVRNLGAETSAGGKVSGWWADARLAAGTVEVRAPLTLSGEFVGKLADTRPLVAFYEVKRDLPRWAERLLTVEGISLSGRFRWSPGTFELERAQVPLTLGELRAKLHLEKDSRHGRFLARWRRLAVGVELDGDERRLKLRGAEEWFEEEEPPGEPGQRRRESASIR